MSDSERANVYRGGPIETAIDIVVITGVAVFWLVPAVAWRWANGLLSAREIAHAVRSTWQARDD